MRKKLERLKEEKGAVSIEFLGTLPYYFLFFLLLWQVVASGYAVVTARSAANEAAKIYSMTGSRSEAEQTARAIIGNSSGLQFQGLSVVSLDGDGDFRIRLDTAHSLVLIPKLWRSDASIAFDQTAAGRLIE